MSPTLAEPSSPPTSLATSPNHADAWRIVPRSTQPSYPPLPRLRKFRAHVLSIFTSSDLTIVLKIRWNHAFHILKLYQPPQEGKRLAFNYEYTAYACLEQSPQPCVPRCRGFSVVKTKNLRFSKRLARHNGYAEVRKRESWHGLVLEFVPDALSLDTYFEQGICDELKAEVVAALARVHESGVLHKDAVGRNCLVQWAPRKRDDSIESDEGFRIWWIDFDSALTTGVCVIPERVFRRERTRMEEWMRGEMTIYTV